MNNEPILDLMIEITFKEPDDFLKIKETLGRIGVSNSTGSEKRLYPSVLILHKRGKYYLTHFKLLFGLDNKGMNISALDFKRFYTIAKLVSDWGLCEFVSKDDVEKCITNFNPKLVKIVPYQEKSQWEIIQKYQIGVKNQD